MSTRPRPEDYPAPFKGGEQNDRNDTRVGETNQDGEKQGHGEQPASHEDGVRKERRDGGRQTN